ncbi:hypothetical protein D3C75_552420 [compost metagenome]
MLTKKSRGFKRSGFLVLSILLLTFVLSPVSAFAQETEYNEVTVNSYIAYLASYDAETAVEQGVDEAYAEQSVTDAKINLEKFKQLSEQEQEKFVYVINNPTIIENVLSGETNTEIPELTFNEESKVVPSQESGIGLRANYYTREIEHYQSVDLYGVDIIAYQIFGTYKYDLESVLEASSVRAIVVKNLNPLCTTYVTSTDKYLTGDTFVAKATYYLGYGPVKGLSVQISTVYAEVRGDKSGKKFGLIYSS